MKIVSMSDLIKPRHQTTNMKAYNASLTARGSLFIGLDKDLHRHCCASGKRPQPKYGEAAQTLIVNVARSASVNVATLKIRAIEVTNNATGDASLTCLLDEIVESEALISVSCEGSYNMMGCHVAIAWHGARDYLDS